MELELFGLHGLEHWDGAAVVPIDAARSFAGAVSEARAEAVDAAIAGLEIEDKVFGLTLHWRRSRDPEATREQAMALATGLARSSGLLMRPGRASVELVLPIGIDKGTVVREQGSGLAAVAYLGDDAGDVHAFDALDELALEGAQVIRIAVSSSEAPAELLERADLVLSGPEESVRLLEAVARAAGADIGAAKSGPPP